MNDHILKGVKINMVENVENKSLQEIKKPYITFVWAEDKEGLIGRDGDLPWSLPADMKFFKDITMDGVVVMGRKTYESIPNPPLKNRVNIILTRNKDFEAEDSIICHDKEEVLTYLKEHNIKKPVHVIGGPAVFEMFMDEVNVLYRTIIDEVFTGDTYMPEIDYKYFRCIDIADGVEDEKNQHPHRFYTYERKNW